MFLHSKYFHSAVKLLSCYRIIGTLMIQSNTHCRDIRQRVPLHYAFVKVGNYLKSQRMDPIEICSMLVEAMDGKMIDHPDEFGSTPLHYAAWRGATVILYISFRLIFIEILMLNIQKAFSLIS